MNAQPFSYYENAHTAHPAEPTTTPTGLAMFGDDFCTFPTLAKRAHQKLLHWSEYDQGGHYAAHQVPDLLVGDVQKFFRILRQGNQS